jgi:hypothetical protein
MSVTGLSEIRHLDPLHVKQLADHTGSPGWQQLMGHIQKADGTKRFTAADIR